MDRKKEFWEDIRNILLCLGSEPVVFIGDFNSIRSKKERKNCVYARHDMEAFNRMIDDGNLLEIEITNAKFTWFGPDGKKSKLDRVLVNTEWLQNGK